MLVPWQLCRAECHERVAVGGHECHPEGRCPEKPGEEDQETRDQRLSFDSVRPSPLPPVAAPPAAVAPVLCVEAHAPVEVAPVPDAPPPVPRTTVLLL